MFKHTVTVSILIELCKGSHNQTRILIKVLYKQIRTIKCRISAVHAAAGENSYISYSYI